MNNQKKQQKVEKGCCTRSQSQIMQHVDKTGHFLQKTPTKDTDVEYDQC